MMIVGTRLGRHDRAGARCKAEAHMGGAGRDGQSFTHSADAVLEASCFARAVSRRVSAAHSSQPRRVVVFDDQHSWGHRLCPGSRLREGNPSRCSRLPQDRHRIVDKITHHTCSRPARCLLSPASSRRKPDVIGQPRVRESSIYGGLPAMDIGRLPQLAVDMRARRGGAIDVSVKWKIGKCLLSERAGAHQ